MLQPWQTGKVIRIENATPDTPATRRFWIELVSREAFHFEPGQFVTLDLPIHEKPSRRWRSYSIASWPDGSPVFELVIVLLDGGAGTKYLFDEIRVGSLLTLRGPQGSFILPQPLEKDLFLICTGTGIAPFRSMVHHIERQNLAHRDIYLIFGCRRLGDALYQKELEDLEERLTGFQYLPVFSREVPENREHLIRTGYVHAVFEEICQKKRVMESLGAEVIIHPASFYLCGWKNMIDEAKKRIADLGYDRKSIHLELYG
jgi:ferredoxin-NADP reductase